MTKICTKCKVEYPATLDYFNKQKHGKYGLRAYCKTCHRADGREYGKINFKKRSESGKAWKKANPEKHKKHSKKSELKKIGFTLELQELMLESQRNLCALCDTDTPAGRHNVWNSDHDHKTGKARGMLCNSCNTTLGHIEAKTIDWMDKARKYIEQGGFYTVTSQETVIQP